MLVVRIGVCDDGVLLRRRVPDRHVAALRQERTQLGLDAWRDHEHAAVRVSATQRLRNDRVLLLELCRELVTTIAGRVSPQGEVRRHELTPRLAALTWQGRQRRRSTAARSHHHSDQSPHARSLPQPAWYVTGMPNRLAAESSPYLRQHADNPVEWWPWGDAAFAEAKRRNAPVFVSIGYAACHWCHVMAHESFEDAATAKAMNELFVNIKVDREERPDIDQIYMAALHHLGEHGGWPLTMFLTPAGEPIWGGTYFPKTSRYGKPAFVDVLREIARLFREEPQKIETNRAALMEQLAATVRKPG